MATNETKKRSAFFQAEQNKAGREPEPIGSPAVEERSQGSGSAGVRPSDAVHVNMFSSFGPSAWERESNLPKISFRKFPPAPAKLVNQTSLIKDQVREGAGPTNQEPKDAIQEPVPPGAFQVADVQTFTFLNTLHAYDPLTYRRVFRWISGDLANNFVNSLKKKSLLDPACDDNSGLHLDPVAALFSRVPRAPEIGREPRPREVENDFREALVRPHCRSKRPKIWLPSIQKPNKSVSNHSKSSSPMTLAAEMEAFVAGHPLSQKLVDGFLARLSGAQAKRDRQPARGASASRRVLFLESGFSEALIRTPIDDLRQTISFGRLAAFTKSFSEPGERILEKFDLLCVPAWRKNRVDLLTADLRSWQLTWYEISPERTSKEVEFPTVEFVDRFELFLIREIRSKGGQVPSQTLTKRFVELVQGSLDANGGVLACLLAAGFLKPRPADPTTQDLYQFRRQLHDYYSQKLAMKKQTPAQN